MKRKYEYTMLILTTLFLAFIIYFHNPTTVHTEKKTTTQPIAEVVIKEENYEEYINNLRIEYNNQDIVAVLQVPNLFEEVIVQTDNNDYYLYHTATREEKEVGASFLDYRTNLTDSKKKLIYSHSDPWDELPFTKIKNYNNKEYMENNPYIYLIDSYGKHKYEVFSSYIENKDFDYVNVENFGGLTYKEHLEKLRIKSFVQKQIELNDDTKVLILQTCSFDENISSKHKYQLLIAKLIEE